MQKHPKMKNSPKSTKMAQNGQKMKKTIKNKIGLWSPPMIFSDQKI
jgi:hypothetical protein